MRRALPFVPLVVLAFLAVLAGQDRRTGRYRKKAPEKVQRRWLLDYERKKDLVPDAPRPPFSRAPAVDFSGTYRFGPYDYALTIRQRGDEVTFESDGVDLQDIGGAWVTVGAGRVEAGRIRARWWCVDVSRNYANNGGCEMWFEDGERKRLHVRYYHDADRKIEEGYGVRSGTYGRERLHYRIRVKHPVKEFADGLVLAGVVRGRGGEAVRDAVVMLRSEEASAVRTDAEGRFRLRVTKLPTVQMVAAAAPGYRTRVEAILFHEVRPLAFTLDPSPYSDDPRYEFVSPEKDKGREIFRCGNCHRNSYDEWKESRHAVAAVNAVTRAVYERSYLKDLASGAAAGDPGLCAACHAPEAALDGKEARMNDIAGTARFGNHCDLCHKVHHVEDLEAPGVRGSLALGRPSPDDTTVPGPIKRIYGALADSDYGFMGPVYNPLFATSALCAGCHQHTTPAGVPALDTYGEWRRWAADEEAPKSCQACHMPTGVSVEGSRLARRICVNGLRRPPEQIHEHGFRGRALAKDAVELGAGWRRDGDAIVVDVRVAAKDVGHRIPTGTGDKHLLLVVAVVDADGAPLPLAAGPRVPGHAGGDGDPLALDAAGFAARLAAGDFAGAPGREFAQVLADAHGSTHVPFWRAVRVVADTRLAPGEPVASVFRFAEGGRARTVRVQLWHRLRYKRGDVADGIQGPGVRPRDELLATRTLEPR